MTPVQIEVPHGRLATPTDDERLRQARKQMREALLRGESVEVREGGKLSAAGAADGTDQAGSHGPSIVVPPGKLATSLFWYENDPDLYRLEVQAMSRRESPFRHFQLRKEADGRLSWLGKVTPGLLAGGKRTYVLHAIYDHNHPHNDSYGGSVKVYMVDPDLDELKDRLPIPHLLRDSAGSVYLCTARREDFRTGRVTTSAASALGWALKWIAMFELYLSDEVTYEQFADHDGV